MRVTAVPVATWVWLAPGRPPRALRAWSGPSGDPSSSVMADTLFWGLCCELRLPGGELRANITASQQRRLLLPGMGTCPGDGPVPGDSCGSLSRGRRRPGLGRPTQPLPGTLGDLCEPVPPSGLHFCT